MDGKRRIGIEFKYSQAPATSKSMHVAMADLKLDRLMVVYPGEKAFPLGEKMTAVPIGLLDKEF